MTEPIPDYKNLDLSGEALQAAMRMEARAREPASEKMFQELVFPMLTPTTGTVLEFGCGTAALARRIARAAPHAVVYASDKSAGMLKAARQVMDAESLDNLRLECWDILDPLACPFPAVRFDLIISSVVNPYLDDNQTIALVDDLVSRLAPGGTLAFVEQDWMSDAVNIPRFELFRDILQKDSRSMKHTLTLGLRPVLRQAGLQVLPRRSFLWTDDAYGDYTRDLLERFADSAFERGQIKPEERDEWKATLLELAGTGDFFYGIVYHLVAGQRR